MYRENTLRNINFVIISICKRLIVINQQQTNFVGIFESSQPTLENEAIAKKFICLLQQNWLDWMSHYYFVCLIIGPNI